MALDFPSLPYDGQIFVDPTTGSKYIWEAATTKWKSIQHTGVIVAYGFDKANSAFLVANAAYDAANNVGPQIAPTYNTANAAFDKANAAYAIQNVDFTLSNSAFTHANAAYDAANNVGPQIAPTYNTANAAFDKANAALANTSGTYFSGDLFFPSGNVGIGDTSANAKLYIRATNEEVGLRVISYQQTAIVGYSSAGGAGGGFYSKDFNGIDVTADASGYGARITSRSGYGAYITSISGSPLVVGKTAGADYLTVTTSGNTGFGTSSPAYKIDVAGAANISNPTLIVADQNVISILATSYDTANAAYGAANNVGPQIAPAFDTANAAFGKANTTLQNTTGTFSGTLTVTGNIIMGGGTSVGYLTIPQNSQTSAYVLVASDTGKHISITTGGVTVNASVFSVGDTVLIYNNSGSNQTITQGTNVTLRLSGTATTGNRTLAQYGTATILCVTGGANPVFVISGSGLS